jgi:hypothetical protein
MAPRFAEAAIRASEAKKTQVSALPTDGSPDALSASSESASMEALLEET